MMLDDPFISATGTKQQETDRNTALDTKSRVKLIYKVGDKVPLRKDGIL